MCAHSIGVKVDASYTVGDSCVGFRCWDTPCSTSTCRCVLLSVWVCSCWDSSSAAAGLVSLCALSAMLWCHCCPARHPLVVSRRLCVVGQASTQASSGSAAASFSWSLSVWGMQESGITRLLSSVNVRAPFLTAPLLKRLQRYNHCLVFGPSVSVPQVDFWWYLGVCVVLCKIGRPGSCRWCCNESPPLPSQCSAGDPAFHTCTGQVRREEAAPADGPPSSVFLRTTGRRSSSSCCCLAATTPSSLNPPPPPPSSRLRFHGSFTCAAKATQPLSWLGMW